MKLQPYIGDLHVHSRRSDGELRPEQIFECAAGRFLDCVALADHDARPFQGVFNGVLSIPAAEFSLGHNWHMVALGASIPTPWPNAREMADWSHELHEMGGALILAHPWTVSARSAALQMIEDWLSEGILDGLELLNTSVLPAQRSAWQDMFKIYQTLWEVYHPAVIGGSDYHHLRHGGHIGLGCTYIFAEAPTMEALLTAVRRRQTVATVIRAGEMWGEWLPWLNAIMPRGELGIGSPDLVQSLARLRRTAHHCRSPLALQAAQAGNYRLAIDIDRGEQGG